MANSHQERKRGKLPGGAAPIDPKLRDKLLQADRLVAVGKLSRDVAHRLNSHLTGILTYAHFLLSEISESDPKREYAETILKETNSCRDIIAQFQEIVRGGTAETAITDLNQVIEKLFFLLERKATMQNVKLVKKLRKGLPHLALSVAQVRDAFWNLLTNALEAMPKGGSLTIETTMDKANNLLVVKFTDSAPHIPQEDMPHLFELFSAVRRQQAGLGLYSTYWIIKNLGGTIEVKSKPPQGNTFIIKLPPGDKT